MSQTQPENPMGAAPIPKLLWKTAIPMMLSLMVNSLYNVVDSIFVAQISESALTALSLAAPIQALIAALGSGIAVGLNSAVSRALGEQAGEKVRHTSAAAMFLAICAFVLIFIAGLTAVKPYFAWQSGGNAAIAEQGEDYLRICMLFSFGQMAQWVLDRFLIAAGRSGLFLASLSSASLINLILDPILIFGWWGVPAMGVTGAAVATVLGQIGGAAVCAFLNRRWNPELPLCFTLRPRLGAIREILQVGAPTALMQGIVAMTGILMNLVLTGFSTTAVAVFGICNRIQGLAIIAPNGINISIIPIIAYNYGARRQRRIDECIRWALIDAFMLMAAMLLALEILPGQILSIFDASADMLQLGIPAIRTLSVGYFISVFGLACSSVFQALGRGGYSMVLTLLRQAVLPLIFVLTFAALGNLPLVWLASPLAEVLSIPFALVLMRRARGLIMSRSLVQA